MSTSWSSIEDLCDRTLGSRPSASQLAILKNAENERPEVKDFVERAFRLMVISHSPAENMTPSLAWILGIMISRLLPGAWGNVVPPFTLEDRHKLIDAYLRATPWGNFSDGTVLLEMGCGFPPQTALDAARNFPDWHILGADLQFDPYVLHDAQGNYACMNAEGEVRYFHPGMSNGANFLALYTDPSATFQQFRMLFKSLHEKLPAAHRDACVSIEHEGARLMRNPIKSYERPNLTLLQAGLGAETPSADIIRVFNVLFYFDAEFRSRAEEWVLRTLRPGGLFLCGADGSLTLEARYSVYRNEHGRLEPKEFAFGLDNVRPSSVLASFCLHDQEKETFALAKLVGVLRGNEEFRRDYDARFDELLAEKRIWIRQDDGFFGPSPDQLASHAWVPAYLDIQQKLEQEGFANRAVSVLQSAGYEAWINCVGHLAVKPQSLASF
jgi:SAM-dependent methyltransferase